MKSNFFKQYEIEIFQLQNKNYEYSFEVDNLFFEHYEGSLTSKGNVRANVLLTKNNDLFHFEMTLNGWVELVCDRSLETYQQNIHGIEKFIYKYDEFEGELGDGLFGLRNGALAINMSDRIYEGIGIQIPFKKLHPKFLENVDLENEENESLIYSSKELETQNDSPEEIDPRWRELLKLKNNNN
ncbi:MAG: DUF177 domain-containing protein [Cytophagales bacterium]